MGPCTKADKPTTVLLHFILAAAAAPPPPQMLAAQEVHSWEQAFEVQAGNINSDFLCDWLHASHSKNFPCTHGD